jgi:leucyl-tRNA synthetase
MTAAESADRVQTYDPRAIQEKWQARWEAMDLFRASDDPDDPRPRRYVLDMFPYPSGDLHMGHAEAYAVADAMARYYFQRGDNVLHPIGWDAFGLPAENAAIRGNSHPADWTYKNIETQAASFRSCTSAAWRTGRTATSTGARSTRPCWPTSRSSAASASAAAPRSSAGR